MSLIQFVLPIDVLEILVVRVQYKELRFKVMTPISQSPNYDIKLLVISAIVALGSIEFLTEMSNMPFGLN